MGGGSRSGCHVFCGPSCVLASKCSGGKKDTLRLLMLEMCAKWCRQSMVWEKYLSHWLYMAFIFILAEREMSHHRCLHISRIRSLWPALIAESGCGDLPYPSPNKT
jgi:hypothetical protein